MKSMNLSEVPTEVPFSFLEEGGSHPCFDDDKLMHVEPERIGKGPWANRKESSFEGAAFDALVENIRSTGGNTVPVLLRLPSVPNGCEFEIVYGHRRHQACLKAGLKVLCFAREMTDQEAVVEMEKENESRTDLSNYEKGLSYKRLRDSGLYASNAKLAKALGADESLLGKLIRLVELPQEVLKAFAPKMDLQVRWGLELEKALEVNREEVLRIAKSIASRSGPRSSEGIFKELTAVLREPDGRAPRLIELRSGKRKLATISIPPAATGKDIEVKLPRNAVDPDELERALRNLLGIADEGHHPGIQE